MQDLVTFPMTNSIRLASQRLDPSPSTANRLLYLSTSGRYTRGVQVAPGNTTVEGALQSLG